MNELLDVKFMILTDCEEGEKEVASSWMPHAPRIGEIIWIQNFDNKMTTLLVKKVCYWCPNKNDKGWVANCCYCRSVCVYVDILEE